LAQYSCSICEDEKYIYDATKGWVRCVCLEKEKFNRKLIEAGICFPKDDLTVVGLASKFPHTKIDQKVIDFSTLVKNRLMAGEKPDKIVCFQGQSNGCKDLVVQTALLGAVEGGMTVNQCSMEQLISNHFQGGEISLQDEFKKADIMCLSFGSELQFNVSGNFLQSLVRLNWLIPEHYLFLHTNLRWDDIAYKYGDAVLKLFVKSDGKILDPERRIVFSCVEE
jgi:hypothetical protein